MINCFYELVSTIQFREDISVNKIQSTVASFINKAMLYDQELKELHHQNTLKFYTFCAPYPLEKDKVYHKGRFYCFQLRTINLKFALAMKKFMPKAQGNIKVIAVEMKNHQQKHIGELISLTPAIATVNGRSWLPENGIVLLSERLHNNAVKKLKLLDVSFAEPKEFFFDHIQLTNKKPISVSYKDTVLLGHKIQFGIKPQKWAQDLAFTVLGGGCLEKNSIGFGYCIAGR